MKSSSLGFKKLEVGVFGLVFSVKSLTNICWHVLQLIKFFTWKSKWPRHVNITIWVMIFGALNYSLTIQRKLPSHYLLPSIFALCLADDERSQHLFFWLLLFKGMLVEVVFNVQSSIGFYWFVQGQCVFGFWLLALSESSLKVEASLSNFMV